MAERVWSEKDLVREGIERHSTPASWSARGRLRPPTSRSCAGSPSCGMISTLNGRPIADQWLPPPHRGPGDRWFGVCAGGHRPRIITELPAGHWRGQLHAGGGMQSRRTASHPHPDRVGFDAICPACPLQRHPVALRWPHSRCPRQRQHPIRPTGFRTMGLPQGKKVGNDSA